jgi:DNA mismatch repair protein MSH6
MDELGRGTSTFDGTAIASATVKHLVENNQCLSLFATHYHSVLDEWQHEPKVRLGHMQCLVEKRMSSSSQSNQNQTTDDNSITFLYTLGEGTCPKSFGINVAQLAGLPEEVLRKAKQISSTFEAEQAAAAAAAFSVSDSNRADLNQNILAAIDGERWDELIGTWNKLQK